MKLSEFIKRLYDLRFIVGEDAEVVVQNHFTSLVTYGPAIPEITNVQQIDDFRFLDGEHLEAEDEVIQVVSIY